MNYFFSIRPPPLNAPHTALIKKLCRSILPLQCSLAALLSLRVTKTRRDMNKQRLRQGQRVETEARACVCVAAVGSFTGACTPFVQRPGVKKRMWANFHT